MYKNFKDDRSSDEDYKPPKAVNREVAMEIGEGRNTDASRISDSKYTEEEKKVEPK